MENLNVELLDSSRSSCLSALDMFDALSMDIESSQIEIRKLKEIVEKFPTASVRKNKEENSKTSDKKLKRVEDALLERKEKTERKLARLREEKLRKEMESCKAKPSINKKSKRMVGKDRVSLSERSKRYVEDRDKRTQKLREQLEQEKQTEFKPKINQKSRTMHRSVSEMMAWKEKAELKKEANRMIAKVEEEKALRRNMKPQINKRSERLARRRARKNDEVGSTVGDRLNLAAKKRRERMERKRQEEQKRAMAQRRPKLSKRSANYKRREDGHRNAADRLYFSAQRTDMKKQYVKEREDYLKTPSFVPKINKKSRLMAEGKLRASASRGAARLAVARGNDEDDDDEYVVSSTRSSRKTKKVRVEDRLAKKAEEYEQRRKRRVENLEKKANEMSRKVATNRRSEFLAGDREISSTLHRPIGNVRPSTISDMSKDCTFSPALLSRSKKKKKKKKKKLDDDDEEEEDDQYSKKLVASSSFSTTKSDNVSKVFERNQKWLEKRQLKHQQKLSEKLKSSAEKCTVRFFFFIYTQNVQTSYMFIYPLTLTNSSDQESIKAQK